MDTILSAETSQLLEQAQNIWFASVRPEGRAHLTPVWFAWHAGGFFICIDPASVKSRNIAVHPQVALALEDGLHPVICEGTAVPLKPPWPDDVLAIFKNKYDWDLRSEARYTQLLRITPAKWLTW